MGLGDYPHLSRQDRPQMLQSVAITPGTGKSHLLIALGHAAVHTERRVRYLTAAELVERPFAGLADNTVDNTIDTRSRQR